MSYTVSVNHPHFPDGTEFGIGTFGTIPNGGSKEIDEDEERQFVMTRGLPLDEAFKGDHAIKVSGSSSLDKSEMDSILEFFATPEEEVSPQAPISGSSAFSRSKKEDDETTADEGGES